MDIIMIWAGTAIVLSALACRIVMHFRFRRKEAEIRTLLDQKYGRIEKE